MKITKAISFAFIFLVFIFSKSIWADANQYVPGQLGESYDEIGKMEDQLGVTGHLPLDGDSPQSNVDGEKGELSVFLPDEKTEGYLEDSTKLPLRKIDAGLPPPDTMGNLENYLESNNLSLLKKMANNGKSGFSIVYIMNNYDYKDSNNIFERTFADDHENSTLGGTLHFSREYYFSRGKINLFWGSNLGIGYSAGDGVFARSGTKSDARIILWSVPIDLSVGVEMPFADILKFVVTGGPSIMGLLQNRSDMEDGENGKRRRQIGFGYFAGAKLKVGLSTVFPDNGFSLLTNNSVSNFSFSAESRFQSYDNFQDEISISGLSFGAGFSFEFL